MHEAVDSVQARDSRLEQVRSWGSRTAVLTGALAGFVLILFVLRLWLTRKIVTPWIMSDELLYSELARSFADEHRFLVRDAFYPIYNVGYSLLISPAWLAGSMKTTYELAKMINVVLMTLGLIPVYLWSRRLMRPLYAVLATALAALLPAFLYTGMIMTENGSFAATMLAFFAIALMLERPTPLREVAALAAVGLSYFVRGQSLILGVVLPAAVLLKLALDTRAAPGPGRGRFLRREAMRYVPLAGIYVAGIVGYVLYKTARGVPLSSGLGVYSGLTVVHYSLSDSFHWTVEHFAELGLALGIFPISALIVLLGLALLRGAESPAERAFLAVAGSAVVLIVVQVAVYASVFSLRIEERYMFFLAPLLLMALLLWLDRGLPRPPILTAFAAFAPAALLLALPLEKRLNMSTFSDTFAFIPLLRLSYHFSIPTVRWLMLAAGLAAAITILVIPRRFATLVLPSAIAIYLVLTTYAVYGAVRDFSKTSRVVNAPAQLDWVDARLPKGETAGFIFGGTADPFGEAQRMWQTEFWNRDVKRVYNIAPEPASFAKTPAVIDFGSGRIVAQDGKPFPYDYAIAGSGLGLSGQVVATAAPFALYRVHAPLRLEQIVEGLYPDGWTGPDAGITRYTGSAGRFELRLSRESWAGPDVPGQVTIELGRPVPRSGGGLTLGKVLTRRTWMIHSQARRTFTFQAPKPPYRIEIHVRPTFSPSRFGSADTRELGTQLSFSGPGG
jgi:hypothetical protein